MTESKSETKGPSKEALAKAKGIVQAWGLMYIHMPDKYDQLSLMIAERLQEALDARDVPSEEGLFALAKTWCTQYAAQLPGMFDLHEGIRCYVAGYGACLERMKGSAAEMHAEQAGKDCGDKNAAHEKEESVGDLKSEVVHRAHVTTKGTT